MLTSVWSKVLAVFALILLGLGLYIHLDWLPCAQWLKPAGDPVLRAAVCDRFLQRYVFTPPKGESDAGNSQKPPVPSALLLQIFFERAQLEGSREAEQLLLQAIQYSRVQAAQALLEISPALRRALNSKLSREARQPEMVLMFKPFMDTAAATSPAGTRSLQLEMGADDFTSPEALREMLRQVGPHAKIGSLPMLLTANRAWQLREFIDAGADVNVADIYGVTLLHRAAALGSHGGMDKEKLPMLRMLLAAGAEVNARDQNGRTALVYVLRTYSDELRSQRRGKALAAPESQNVPYPAVPPDSRDAIALECVRLLVRAGANISSPSLNGRLNTLPLTELLTLVEGKALPQELIDLLLPRMEVVAALAQSDWMVEGLAKGHIPTILQNILWSFRPCTAQSGSSNLLYGMVKGGDLTLLPDVLEHCPELDAAKAITGLVESRFREGSLEALDLLLTRAPIVPEEAVALVFRPESLRTASSADYSDAALERRKQAFALMQQKPLPLERMKLFGPHLYIHIKTHQAYTLAAMEVLLKAGANPFQGTSVETFTYLREPALTELFLRYGYVVPPVPPR